MAWKRDGTFESGPLTLEDRQRRAIELRQEFYRSKEIEEILRSGDSAWVIQKWLRDKGAIPSTEEEVLKLVGEGKTTREIAAAVRVTPRRVQQILRAALGPVRTQNTTEANIDLYLANPKKYFKAEFTQKEAFGWGLLKRCVEVVDQDPKEGLSVVNHTAALFDRIKRTRRKEWTKRLAVCLYAQSRGIESHVYAVTGEFRFALEILTNLLDEITNCISCEADYKRRIGVVYYYWERLDDAWVNVNAAMQRYRDLSASDHDLLGNGLANCHLLSSHIHYELTGPKAGATEARKGMALLTGNESPTLLCYLVFALAKCLLPSKDPREIEESSLLLDWCFENIDTAGKQSEPRAMLCWLKGQLLTVKGQREEAIEYLTVALEDAQECKNQDVPNILADLGALNPDPREVRNHIEDFCSWDDRGELIVPPWCGSLEGGIRSVYELTLNRTRPIDISVFAALRKVAGGESRMPSFIIPSSAATDGNRWALA